MPIYGDQQAQFTMNRAAYGDVPAAMMGGTVYGGMGMGMGNMMSDIGQSVMPVAYHAPVRVHAGYHGMYQQHQGMMRGMANMVGIGPVPRGVNAMEHSIMTAGDFGERIGGGMAGMATTAGGLVVGGTVGSAVAGFAGAAIGTALGGPIGGAVGGFLGSTVGGYMLGMAGADVVQSAIGQRRDIQNFLESSSFRFVGAGSAMADPRSGAGMSRAARSATSEFIRQQDIRDPMMNTGELTSILQQGSQLGLFNGSQDLGDFQKKFKDITEAVKSVTKTLHQTLEEGMRTIKDLKGIGIDPSQVKSVVTQADMLGKMAGRSGSEMLALGLQGAELFRGTGVTMGIGAQATMMNLASIRASRDAGALSQEAIAQAGGEEALAMRQTAQGLAFGQSAMGRGMGAAFFNGGGLNGNAFMANMMAGGGNFVGLAAQAAGNLSSPAAMIAYQANQEKFMSEVGSKFGGRGLQMMQLGSAAAYAGYMSSATGAKFEDAFRLSLKEQGLSSSDIDARFAEIRSAEKNFQAAQAAAGATKDKQIIDEASNNFVLNRASAQVGDFLKRGVDVIARPLNNMIDATGEAFVNFRESQVLGVRRGSSAGYSLAGDFAGAGAADIGAANLDVGGMFATTAGENILSKMKNKNVRSALGLESKSINRSKVTSDMVVLNEGMGGNVDVVSKADFEAAAKKSQVLGMTEAEAKHMQEAGLLKNTKGSLIDVIAEGKTGGINDFKSLATAFFGADAVAKGLSQDQMAKLIVETKGTSLEGIVTDVREGANAIKSGQEAARIDQLATTRTKLDESKARLDKAAGMKLSESAVEKLAEAANIEKRGGTQNLDRAKRLRAEAAAEQAHVAGVDFKDATDAISRVSGNAELGTTASLLGTMKGIQVQRGTSALSSAVEAELFSEKGDKIPLAQKEKIRDVAAVLGKADLKDFLKLSKDENMRVIQETDTGKALINQAQALEKVSGLEKGDAAGLRKVLSKAGFGGDMNRLVRIQAEQGSAAAAQAAFEDFAMASTSKGGVSAAGGAAKDGAPSAEQSAATQTSINLQTLAVMQGLAARLGVK